MSKSSRAGFTQIETAAVIAIGTVVTAQLMPMARKARFSARGTLSASNLMQIGQGAGMYGLDNADRMPSYSWGGPSSVNPSLPRYTLPSGEEVVARDDLYAASAQHTEILQRRTGRIDGEFKIGYNADRVWHRRWNHLVLIDYMNSPIIDSLFIDPADTNQLNWAADPLNYGVGSDVPYANGLVEGYDPNGGWLDDDMLNRWAFASSYQTVPAAWQPDGLNNVAAYAPVSSTPNLFAVHGSAGFTRGVELSDGRRFSEVRFPTAKVYMFEEFDREQAGDPYFGYDHARPEKLMFDGSINTLASGDASPSWNVAEGKVAWVQTYVPIDTFPIPLGGLGDQTLISQRYRWTLGGLQGVDYARPLRGSNPPALRLEHPRRTGRGSLAGSGGG